MKRAFREILTFTAILIALCASVAEVHATKITDLGPYVIRNMDPLGQNANISYLHLGVRFMPPDADAVPDILPAFNLRAGSAGTITHGLVGHFQESSWDVVGIAQGNDTRFFRTQEPGGGFVAADARVNGNGLSLSGTRLSINGTAVGPPAIAIASPGATRDDAFVDTSHGLASDQAGSNTIFSVEGGIDILQVTTNFVAQSGASGSIVSTGSSPGLTLTADPGQQISYLASATNNANPAESFSWFVIFDGISLLVDAIGIDNPLPRFLPVPDGYFLPYSEMPGRELSASLGSAFFFSSNASAQQVRPAPEPPTFALFGAGTLALFFWYGWRRKNVASTPSTGDRV